MTFIDNKSAFEAAQKLFTGGINSPVRAFKSVGGTPPFIDRGEGGLVFDIEGNGYIDFVQSWGALILGHARAEVIDAVIKTAKKGLSFGAPTLLESELAELILSVYGFLDKLRFVSSGTEAVMTAIRLARGVTGRDKIVKFKGCYHGHSDSLLVEAGSGAATFGAPSSLGVPNDFAKHTLLAEYNDVAGVRRLFDEHSDIAAIVIEPIAGNMGLVCADEEFLRALRDLCDRNGALLIFDEVMSGFRASLRGACGFTDVLPDIVTFGKVIGGGLPVAALGAKKEIMDALSPIGKVYQAGTLSGNPVATTAGIAALKILIGTPDLYETLENRAKRLTGALASAAESAGAALQIEYRGSMFGFFFNKKPVSNFAQALQSDTARFARFHGAMLKRGVYLAPSQFETGFISLATSDDMIKTTIAAAQEAMRETV
ncbi:MAG: glutamate-1-semialdehyde 2,1-aminomutase [Helicobacteraceae bacterium]|jgi:glutamate-1-semialdehyde 2,1-aminomutase|nr:glutamate-1-semialdehyde 2,1-aminomutase [Helicobacteraceae bacterium]